MHFNIYRDKATYTVTDGDSSMTGLASEAAAADVAIRIAQDRDVLYSISYWRP